MIEQPPDAPDSYQEENDNLFDEEPYDEGSGENTERRVNYRSTAGDPLFGLLVAGALSVGLTPLIGTDADMRYTLVWGLLALFGVISWLLGDGPRIGEEIPENLAWGIAFGLILALPLLAFGGRSLSESSDLLFQGMKPGAVLAYLVFVMPLAETLFFRGVMQKENPFWSTGLICTAWNLVLFFPLMNKGAYPLIVGVILLMANSMYGYVRERNGLAAAWLCQITVNILLWFVPVAG